MATEEQRLSRRVASTEYSQHLFYGELGIIIPKNNIISSNSSSLYFIRPPFDKNNVFQMIFYSTVSETSINNSPINGHTTGADKSNYIGRYRIIKVLYNGQLAQNQGPVVQSVVSLTSSLRVIPLTVLADSIHNILIFFAEKMCVAFALQKLLTFFQQKISAYLRITRCKF